MSPIRIVSFPALLLAGAPLAAQDLPQVPPTTTPTPGPTPVATPTPATTITVPAASPTPTPSPTAVARPRRAPTAVAPRPAPVPSSTPQPDPTPAPIASEPPAAEPAAVAPPAIASPLPTSDDVASDEQTPWPLMLGAAVLLVAGIGLWLARRQRTPEDEEIGAPTDADEPEAIVPPTPAPTVVPTIAAPRAGLKLSFRPTRVGFNMLSATAEGELTIANDGDAPADDVRVRTALLGAHVGQDADLAAFLAEPMGRPVVPAFSLRPGEERTVRVVAATPRGGLRTMVAAGRPMFVPVLAVDLRAAGAQVAQAFAIGVERVDSAKLAPFWLDVPDRAYTEVAARPHGPAISRQPNG